MAQHHGTLTHRKSSDSTDAGPGEWRRASTASKEKGCLGCLGRLGRLGRLGVDVLDVVSEDLSEFHHVVATQIPHLCLAMSNSHLRHQHL